MKKSQGRKPRNPLSSKQNKNNDISDFHYFAYSFLRFSWKSSGVKGNGFSELSILTPNYPNVMWKVADFKLWHSHTLSFCVWKNGIWAVNSKSPPKSLWKDFVLFTDHINISHSPILDFQTQYLNTKWFYLITGFGGKAFLSSRVLSGCCFFFKFCTLVGLNGFRCWIMPGGT